MSMSGLFFAIPGLIVTASFVVGVILMVFLNVSQDFGPTRHSRKTHTYRATAPTTNHTQEDTHK